MRIRQQRQLFPSEEKTESTLEIWPDDNSNWKRTFLQFDRLVRNLAVVGALFLTIVAVRNTSTQQAQSVFEVLQEGVGIEWDESVGKLSFVSELLPDGLQAVWAETPDISVYAPADGETSHTWSRIEPYVCIETTKDDIRAAADGVVMAVAHGPNEERILRIRHEDDLETVYGNLEICHVDVGDRVYTGDVIGRIMEGQPLAFEVRVEGRSVDPSDKLKPFQE